VRSSELLVAEGFQVNVAMMPAGEDPDTFIRRNEALPTRKDSLLAAVFGLSARPGSDWARPDRRRVATEF
jgi:DNA primase